MYDELYQITSESGLFNHTYQHDSLYCRLTKDNEHYQINALNQIASHIAYDKNGNSLQQGDIKYSWDALDRLIRIQTPDSVQTFTYDSQHRRLSATIKPAQGEETTVYFLYDGQNEIGSLGSNLQVQDFRVLGFAPHAEIGAAVGIELGNKIYAPIHDLSGNITQLLPLDGTEPVETRYSAFGEETGSRISPWRFSSKRVDEKNNLVFFGRRFYQTEFGRWLSPDPAGFTDGMNLYAFVHNAPLTHFDEYGLLDCEQWKKTPQQRLDEQRGMIWGVSRWARSVTSSAIHATAFVNQIMVPGQSNFSTQMADQLERSINRSISRFTGIIAPYQFGNADFNRGTQIGYYGSEALSLALPVLKGLKIAGAAWRVFSNKTLLKMVSHALLTRNKKGLSHTTINWPSNKGFLSSGRASLVPGASVDRYGGLHGGFLAPVNTPFPMRSLPPNTPRIPYRTFQVIKPFEVTAGQTSPWFNQPGMGIQFETDVPIQKLIDDAYLKITLEFLK